MEEKDIQSDDVEYEALSSEEVKQGPKTTHIYCDPCLEDNENNAAEGFCVDCNDYLCCECFRFHSKSKPSKRHVLRNKASMPLVRPQQTHDIEKCTSHDKEILEYYCSSHELPLCKLCKEINHRNCDNVVGLAGIFHDMTKPEVQQEVKDELEKVQKEFDINLHILTQNRASTETYYQNAIRRIRMIRDKDLNMMAAIETTCKTSNTQITGTKKDLEKFQNNDKLKCFVTLKAKAKLKILKKRLTDIKSDNKIIRYFLNLETDFLGYVGVIQKCPLHLEETSLKRSSDMLPCRVTGIEILSDKRLVVADIANKKIKLVDLRGGNVSLELELDLTLWDITKIDDKRIAVTTFEAKILLISITNTMSVQKTIDTSRFGSCISITLCNETLYVAYNSNEIEILDLEGNVQQTLDPKDTKRYFACPPSSFGCRTVECATYSPDTNILYVSISPYNTIYCMTSDGQIISSFTHQQMKNPTAITAGSDGRIFVCCYGSNKIFKIAHDLSQGQILLDATHGISKPHSIKYYDEECKLFVGSENKDTIQVFLV